MGPASTEDARAGWVSGERRTTLAILLDGRFRIDLDGGSVTLSRQGDFVLWGPGVGHSWPALEASTVLTVPWPSLPPVAGPVGPARATLMPPNAPAETP